MPPKKIAPAVSELTVNHALKLAATNPAFARQLVKNPEKFKDQFNLSKAEINAMKGIAIGKGKGGPSASWYEG